MSELLVIQNFINGEFFNPESNEWLDNYEPATGLVYGKVPDSDGRDMDRAVEAAKNAFKIWSKFTKEKRSAMLLRVAQLIEERLEEFAVAESRDNGKPVHLARIVDIPRAILNFRFFATSILHHEEMSTEIDNTCINYTVSQPIGVGGLISPWNLPLYLLTWKIAPCIAVGNTCVCNPSEFTSVTAWMLCSIIKEAGIPDGVVNMVFGLGPKAGARLVQHPDVPLISFTGGTFTGENIIKQSAPNIKKLSLELGGKNPTIIFDDANLSKCIPEAVRSSFSNQGQICLCGERMFVQEGIYDEFLSKFVSETKKLKVGDPNDSTSNLGALISKQHLEKVMSYMELAKSENGQIICGGNQVFLEGRCKEGYFFEPTIIVGLPNNSRVNQEEIFGPTICVIPFKTEEEVIELANAVKYGLSASIWTENLGRANRVSLGLSNGTVWVNCWLSRDLRVPFGGTKLSGIGREGGKFSHEFFTEQKTICINYQK